MSVYIKGMEMPKSCRDCLLCAGQANMDYGVCTWCRVDGKARDAYTRQDCPLIPVPPHGRLGDLDKLTYAMGMDEHFSPLEAIYLMGLVADAPIIIPAEEGERYFDGDNDE